MASEPLRSSKIKSLGMIKQDEHQFEADAKRVILVDEAGNEINSGNPLPVDAIVNLNAANPGTPELTVVTLPADTEVSIAIPDETIRYRLRARNQTRLQLSFVAGNTNSAYYTHKPGNVLSDTELYLESKILYVRSPYGPNVLEFWVWKP